MLFYDNVKDTVQNTVGSQPVHREGVIKCDF